MKISTLVLAIATVAITTQTKAIPVVLDLGPSRVITTPDPSNISLLLSVPFTDLDGALLDHSPVSLDFLFAGNQFVRVYSASDDNTSVIIRFHTDVNGFPGAPGPQTAALIDQNGNQFRERSYWNSANGGSNGDFFVYIFPNTPSDPSPLDGSVQDVVGTTPYDFYGVNFTFFFPDNPTFHITSAEFGLYQSSPDKLLGIGALPPGYPTDFVPDNAVTLELLGSMFTVLVLVRRKFPG